MGAGGIAVEAADVEVRVGGGGGGGEEGADGGLGGFGGGGQDGDLHFGGYLGWLMGGN